MNSKSTTKSSMFQASYTVLLLLSIVSAIYYCIFLLNFSIIDNIYLYGILLFIEFYIILQTIGVWWTTLYSHYTAKDHFYYTHRRQLKSSNVMEGGVDVFITTYGEDLEVISETVQAAKNLHVEHDTYILDDGRDPEVKDLASELGVYYITREDNKHQKAGNMNNALKHTNKRYFAIFDADHKPSERFLQDTLPFFWDKKVAFVQTPQVLKNHDNLISSGSSDSQKLFYEMVGGGKNRFNSMFWVGTNAVFRREAVESVGGIYNHTSEDILTSYLLHQQGWKSVYIPDELALGTGPENISDYMKQQLRWAGGGFTLLLKQNPLMKKLTIDQKFQYFLNSTFYLNGFVVLFMILMPLMYMYFGIKPIEADGLTWFTHYIPYLIFQFFMIMILTGRFSLSAYILSTNTFPAYIKAFFQVLFNKPIKWNVTGQKKTSSEKFTFLRSNLIILFLSFMAIPLAFVHVDDWPLTLLNLFWIILNLISITVFVFYIYMQNSIVNLTQPKSYEIATQ